MGVSLQIVVERENLTNKLSCQHLQTEFFAENFVQHAFFIELSRSKHDPHLYEHVLGPVSTRDNRVLKGLLGRSLRSFARTTHSAHSLRSAPLRYARFARPSVRPSVRPS